MNEYLVSVIIPTFNKGQYIRKTVSSVLNQTYSNLEIILVDNCSEQSTKKVLNGILKLSKKIRLIELKSNLGPSNARNIGITNSNGKYIFLLDGDDIILKNKIETQVKFMENNPKTALSLTSYIVYRGNYLSNQFITFRSIKSALNGWHSMTGYGALVESTGCLNRDYISKNNLFDPNYFGCEGLKFVYEWNARSKVGFIKAPLTIYRISESQLHLEKHRILKDMNKLNQEKWLSKPKRYCYKRFQKSYFAIDNLRAKSGFIEVLNLFKGLNIFTMVLVALILKRMVITRIRALVYIRLIQDSSDLL
jgi:glycosyltransferase involved in cell wall biosynthesis